MIKLSIFLILVFGSVLAWSTDHSAKHYQATRLSVPPPDIDGVLDDDAWEQGEWTGNFIQFEPYNGRKPSQQTSFKVLYDDNNLYVAIRAYDNAPDSIVERLTRRDQTEGDHVAIGFDSYHDERTAFVFGVNAAGVKYDYIISNDGQNEDYTWDPNWWIRTGTDEKGWMAEMRIPLSQLRFEKNGKGLWGVQVIREINRYGETSLWSHIPIDTPGMVHRFGTMGGVNGIEPRRVFDVTPYVISSADKYPSVSGNPFLDGSDHNY
ncbi:MAG: carbohydrate binding family 9 domain-containing protein [Bacteroidales bacterium]